MAYDYMRKHALSAPLIARLTAETQTCFADQATWLAHLHRLGLTTLDVTPNPVRVATEGALWGSIQSHQFLCEAVVLSDDAGQFNVGRHALCWVHAERLVHKLDAFTDKHRAAQTRVRGLIWNYYADLKAYRIKPSPRRAIALRKQFDRIFLRRTGFVTLDRLLKRLHANKAELLMVLDRPETPLHTNGSENDIRCQVTRRKVTCPVVGQRQPPQGVADIRLESVADIASESPADITSECLADLPRNTHAGRDGNAPVARVEGR